MFVASVKPVRVLLVGDDDITNCLDFFLGTDEPVRKFRAPETGQRNRGSCTDGRARRPVPPLFFSGAPKKTKKTTKKGPGVTRSCS